MNRDPPLRHARIGHHRRLGAEANQKQADVLAQQNKGYLSKKKGIKLRYRFRPEQAKKYPQEAIMNEVARQPNAADGPWSRITCRQPLPQI